MAKKARRPAEKKTPREPIQRLSAASVDYIEFAKALERHIQRKLPDTSEFLDYTQHLNDLQLALAKIASHFSKQLEADLLNLASRTLETQRTLLGVLRETAALERETLEIYPQIKIFIK